MKKTFLLFIIALFVVSCEGPMGPEGPQGYGTNWKIIDLEVKSTDWIESTENDGSNRYYSCNFLMPEIDAMVYSEGSVISYIVKGTTQQVLPSVRHYENTYGNMWTQTIDYEFSEGNLDLFVTNSDFAAIPPGDMKVRVVLMW